ncbi:DUF177 domain-containing protein [Candidatus Bipolaricaulota bacterium]|nr:DUF177 domain-containing protein [Candidatus Bipolaricaulota bacterium]
MTLDIREYNATPGHRLPVSVRLTPPENLFEDTDWTVSEIQITGEAFAQLSTLYMEVDVHAHFTQPCRRCLAPVHGVDVVSEPFELQILPGTDQVDVLPVVLQLIQTVHDPHVVCRQTCRGLCPTCGTNLNDDPDHTCREPHSDRKTLRDYLS